MNVRKTIFANGELYHIFNRGIEKHPVFTSKKEYERAVLTLDYYRFKNPSLRLSKTLILNLENREKFYTELRNLSDKLVEIVVYCLMPNHFHFVLKQRLDNGISRFVSNFANSYTRYFNTRHDKRTGALFQGIFKAVHIEDDDQLVHVARYIHINPAVSYVIEKDNLEKYEWSSYPEFLGLSKKEICDKDLVLKLFSSRKSFRKFVADRF